MESLAEDSFPLLTRVPKRKSMGEKKKVLK